MKTIKVAIEEALKKWGREVLREVITVGVKLRPQETVDHFRSQGMESHAQCAHLIYLE